jgi:putative N6-adenine-specific DNA methylase
MAIASSRIVRRKKDDQPKVDLGGSLFNLFATCESGLEDVLSAELRSMGIKGIKIADRGVSFRGNLETIYRANVQLRTAYRVLMEVAEFYAENQEALYAGVHKVQWKDHMGLDQTLAVDAVSNRSDLSHTQFISRVVKDAVVDGFRERLGKRPNVDPDNPDLRINARILNNRCTLSIDTSGERLHRRGYRSEIKFAAPLKETLAAGILLKCGYDGSTPLIDPMCGSGTFLVEAALIAKSIAPGLLGRSFAFRRHLGFDRAAFRNVVDEAKSKIERDKEVFLLGGDIDDIALRAARAAITGAGVDDVVRIQKADVMDFIPKTKGMIITNPPYGERIGEIEELKNLYRVFGDVLKRHCTGMSAHVLTGSKQLSKCIGLHPKKRDILFNGQIECRLLHFELY